MVSEQRLHEFFKWTDEVADKQGHPLDYWLAALDAGFGDLEREDLARVRQAVADQWHEFQASRQRDYEDFGMISDWKSAWRNFMAEWSPDFSDDAA